MFASIPQPRLLLYIALFGLLPIFFGIWYIHAALRQMDQLSESLDLTRQMAVMHEEKQAVNLSVIEFYKPADKFYIDKQVESIKLLTPEIAVLQEIAKQNNFVENEYVKNRLEFLTNTNTIKFAEGVVQSYPFFNEVAESLVQPVQVNLTDLEHILTAIEGTPIGSFQPVAGMPQLIITDFKMDRKGVDKENEVFQLNMKLLKREYN